MKKMLIVSVIVVFIGFAPSALAQTGFVPLAPIPGLTDQSSLSVASSTNLASFFNNLYKYLIGLAATLAVIMIIWGGLEIAINKDNVSKITDSKGKIYNAIFGLVLVLSPVLVFSIINPAILNLSLNLPKLDTKSGVVAGGTAAQSTPSVDTTTGCTVTGTLLKQAACPSQKAAQDFAAACTTGTGRVVGSCKTVNATGGCADTSFPATCDTTRGDVTGPYVFLDVSTTGLSFTGIFNMVTGYYEYEPLAATPSNANNGTAVLNFAATCAAEGGSTCMSASSFFSTACSFTSAQPSSQSNKCYSNTLTCVGDTSMFSTDSCRQSPTFRIIQ